ncbi:MAG: urease accessory protein UreD, partial [Deltaproteobacteria bacterium]|nr:urease accessory protein UreD [Deltaproteobacteria bacterium]
SSLGGGLVDGDDVALEVVIDAGATGLVTTQASTKIYKGTSRQRLDVRVHGDGCALVVPDPIVPFRDASYTQVTRIALDAGASLVLCDIVTAGRLAYGERWSCTRFDSTLSIEIGGARKLHDRVVLDQGSSTRSSIGQRMQRFAAMATAVIVGPRVGALGRAELAALPQVEKHAPVIVAGSEFVDGAMLRIVGEDIEQVVAATRSILRAACSQLGEDPWSRKW